jgi:CheY-like chemotaxis protein
MSNVLVIEDDDFKANSLRDFINEQNLFESIEIVSSLVEAIDAVNEKVYALILVDMAIPSHPVISGGGSPISLLTGGIEILLELNSLERKDPCVVITQYPDIEISGEFFSLQQATKVLQEKLGCKILDCIEYNEGDEKWKRQLQKVIKNI